MAAPIALEPLATPVTATWEVPGSKSLTNRALILAALRSGVTHLKGTRLASNDGWIWLSFIHGEEKTAR